MIAALQPVSRRPRRSSLPSGGITTTMTHPDVTHFIIPITNSADIGKIVGPKGP